MDWFTCQMWKKYSNVEKGSGPEQIFILCVWLLSGFFFWVTGLLRVLTTCWESFFLGLSPGSIARERVVFISFLTSANPELGSAALPPPASSITGCLPWHSYSHGTAGCARHWAKEKQEEPGSWCFWSVLGGQKQLKQSCALSLGFLG